ncbi:MAG: hypothetical protein ACTSRW_08840 [Candidatus Helarchaeota archaeon]
MRSFKEFAERIVEKTGLDVVGGLIEVTFLEYITENQDELSAFEIGAKRLYEEWQEEGGSFLAETDFFVKHGAHLFYLWLTEVFPFNIENLSINVTAHGAVDSQYSIQYNYQIDEIILIRTALKKHGLLNDQALENSYTFFLTNAVKSISRTFSSIINMDYKIFTANLICNQEDFSVTVDYEAAGRIRK